MSEKESSDKQTEQFLRAASAKPPGYEALRNGLSELKREAERKRIPERQIREAIHEVFGRENDEEALAGA